MELVAPALTFPKAKLVGFADKITVPATPVPVSATVEGEVGALLVIVMVPGRLPAVVGAKVALKAALAPAAIVFGVTSPLKLYPAPLTLSCEIVSDALPVFVRVNVCDFVCPSLTLPYAKLAGAMLNPGCVATPVPVSAIVVGEVGALLVTVIVAGRLPAVVGAKVALKVALAQATIVLGVTRPLRL